MNNPFSARHLRPGVLPYFFPDGVTLSALGDALWDNGGRGQIVGPHGTGKSTLVCAWCEKLEAEGVEVRRLKFQSACYPPLREPRADCGRVAVSGRRTTWQRLLLSSMHTTVKLLSFCRGMGNGERKSLVASLPSASLRLRPSHDLLVPRNGKGSRLSRASRRLAVIDGYEQLRWWQRRLVEGWSSWCNVGLLVTTHHDVGLKTIWRTPSSSRLAYTIATRLAIETDIDIPFDVVDRLWQECRGDIRETLFALYDWLETDVAVIAVPAKSA